MVGVEKKSEAKRMNKRRSEKNKEREEIERADGGRERGEAGTRQRTEGGKSRETIWRALSYLARRWIEENNGKKGSQASRLIAIANFAPVQRAKGVAGTQGQERRSSARVWV